MLARAAAHFILVREAYWPKFSQAIDVSTRNLGHFRELVRSYKVGSQLN
jgi:hypothetical protein